MLKQRKKADSYEDRKCAIRSKHRKDWREEYFQKIRNQLNKEQHNQQDLQGIIMNHIKELPQSIMKLYQDFHQNCFSILETMISNIAQISQKMINLKMVQWAHYVSIIMKMLVCTKDKPKIKIIIIHTLQSILQQGSILAVQNIQIKDFYVQIIEQSLQYCFRLGSFVLNINSLELNAIVSIVQLFWTISMSQQQELKLMYFLNNILAANFDEQEIQNITCQEHQTVKYNKRQLIQMVFYKDEAVLRQVLKRCYSYSIQQQNQEMLQLYLRLLINMTLILQQSSYYYKMLQYNIVFMINSNLMKITDKPQDSLWYIMRLINNIMLIEDQITELVSKDLNFTCLINIYKQHSNSAVSNEVLDIFLNVIHFMNQDVIFIRQINNFDIHHYLLQYLQNNREYIDDDSITNILSCLLVLLVNDKAKVKGGLREHEKLLKWMIDQEERYSSIAQQLLKAITQESSI